jgi:hypothetical protein
LAISPDRPREGRTAKGGRQENEDDFSFHANILAQIGLTVT